jgi:RNA polymerase sigma-70 factor (ECF subfamily)
MGRTRLSVVATKTQGAPPLDPSENSQAGDLRLDEGSRARRFEAIFVSHLDAAYNFARWLARDERNAEDVVQEACLRAFKSLDSFHGENGRAWLLAIVRNTYYTWFKRNQIYASSVPFDEESLSAESHELADLESSSESVDQILQRQDARRLVNDALNRLPEEFREVVVLRELEDLSYKEIAAIAGIPLGTVMSRLARARKLLLQHLQRAQRES